MDLVSMSCTFNLDEEVKRFKLPFHHLQMHMWQKHDASGCAVCLLLLCFALLDTVHVAKCTKFEAIGRTKSQHTQSISLPGLVQPALFVSQSPLPPFWIRTVPEIIPNFSLWGWVGGGYRGANVPRKC